MKKMKKIRFFFRKISFHKKCRPNPSSHIVEKSEKDIRTALNSLQYVANMQEITTEKLEKSNIGSKDSNKSLFEIWKEFFKLKNLKSYRSKMLLAQRSNQNEGQNSNKSKSHNLKHALEIIYSSGESNYEKILGGLYENFLNANKSDGEFKNLRKISLNLSRFDLLNRKVRQNQVFQLLGYWVRSFL